ERPEAEQQYATGGAGEYAGTDEKPVKRNPSPVHVRAVTHQHQHHRSTDEECHGERPGELRQDFTAIPMILAHPQQKANGAGRKIHYDDSPKQLHFTSAARVSRPPPSRSRNESRMSSC